MSDVLGGATDAAPEPGGGGAVVPGEATEGDLSDGTVDGAPAVRAASKRRRRGTRGGRGRNRTRVSGNGTDTAGEADDDEQPELPDRPIEGKVQSPEVAERVLVRRPRIGDTRPAPEPPEPPAKTGKPATNGPRKRRRAAAPGRSGATS